MNIEDVKKALPILMKVKLPAMLVGTHGVGKTQGVKQFAKENGYLIKIVNLGCEDVGDLKGLPEFVEDDNGNITATAFMKPDWAEEMLNFCHAHPDKKAILFLDEFNRAKRDLIQASFPLLTEYRLNQVVFPDNFYVMAAINPDTEDYTTLDISDKALMDRFCHIKITSSYENFIAYGKTKGFHKSVLNFISAHPGMLRANTKEFQLKYVEPSDRSWEKASQLIELLDKKEVEESIFNELLAGLLGLEASTAYMAWKKTNEKPVEGSLVLKDYSKVQKIIKAQGTIENYRSDLLNETKTQVLDAVAAINVDGELPEKEYGHLVAFMNDLPNDLFAGFLKSLMKFPKLLIILAKNDNLTAKIQDCLNSISVTEDKEEQVELEEGT